MIKLRFQNPFIHGTHTRVQGETWFLEMVIDGVVVKQSSQPRQTDKRVARVSLREVTLASAASTAIGHFYT